MGERERQVSFLEVGPEVIDYKGYEQRVSYDLEKRQWKVLSCVPSSFPPFNDYHSWEYGATREAAVGKALADVDAWLAAGDATDRADFDRRYKSGEITFQSLIHNRWRKGEA